jgi:hypothetical protein
MERDLTSVTAVGLAVSFLPDDNVIATVTTSDQIELVGASVLTFTLQNWNVSQSIRVRAKDDTIREGEHRGTVTVSVSSSDSRFHGITVELVISIEDNDCDGYHLSDWNRLVGHIGTDMCHMCVWLLHEWQQVLSVHDHRLQCGILQGSLWRKLGCHV